jgi:putative pyruvate formate lyase activating enzyme
MHDLHFWEEPPVSGTRGSGAVFFSRCNMKCVFCQNHVISQGSEPGVEMDPGALAGVFVSLEKRGAHNVNLVSPTHYSGEIAQAIAEARRQDMTIPFVYNSNGYDSVETLARMDGLIEVYMPDLKYRSEELSAKYSATPSYFEHASRALVEMARQVGPSKLDENGIIEKGLIVRHLVLPGCVDDSLDVLRWVKDNLPEGTFLSVMSQYHPCHLASRYPEIDRRLTEEEYSRVLDEVDRLGLGDGFIQELSSAEPLYTPDFSRRSRPS